MSKALETAERIATLLNTGLTIVKIAKGLINDAQEAGHVIGSNDEATIEAAIAELEALLPDLRTSTQNKLRGG